MIYIIKQEAMYQYKVNSSLASSKMGCTDVRTLIHLNFDITDF